MGRQAVVLTGSLGMGHHVVTEVVTGSLGRLGFAVSTLDCMALMGRWSSRAGDRVFRRLLATPTLYDGLHFAHLRPGSPVAGALDAMATSRLVPALAREIDRRRPELVCSTFATGASAAAKLAARPPALEPGSGGGRSPADGEPRGRRPVTVVLCTDVTPHRLWVQPGIDLFLVTSPAAAAAVRRHQARAHIAVVPPPVRPAFGDAPGRQAARRALGVPDDARCALVMGGGWGLGPLAAAAGTLAAEGVTVLAVAGSNRRLHRALRALASASPGVVPFGLVEDVPVLMSAADVVITTPGASTCAEARAMARPLILLDVVPGHGRDNVQHELELGDAEVCDAEPARLTASVLAVLERVRAGAAGPAPAGVTAPSGGTAAVLGPEAWERAFADALAAIGLGPPPWPPGVPSMAGGPADRPSEAGPAADRVAVEEVD